MNSSRRLELAVRRSADDDTDRFADIPQGIPFMGTLTTVTAGAAPDGNAALEVTWRGSVLPVNGYSETYTPAVGDRVRCVLLADGQLTVDGRYIGGVPD